MVVIEPSHEQETIMAPKPKLGTSHEMGKKKWPDCQFSLFLLLNIFYACPRLRTVIVL